ncbi:MAG: adenylate/guanylate cyclase domain-containing protein [Bacteroidota bacterium]
MKSLVLTFSKREIYQAIQITLAWTFIGIIAILYDYSLSFTPYVRFEGVSLKEMLFAQITTSIVSSFITGLIIVKFFIPWIRSRPYGKALLMTWLTYTLLSFLTATIALSFFYPYKLGIPYFSLALLQEIVGFIFGPEFIRYYFLWLFILMTTMIALLVNDKYGPGIFKDFLLGKYFQPRRTERIFMFLDLRGSTRIAEQLGEVKYFSFLKDAFLDVTPAIIYSGGEIYQYVGDEIVVSWKVEKGVKQAQCLKSFVRLQEDLKQKSEYYQKVYGVIPEFKAGLHAGFVIAGEIGAIKREITFSGDVLNTSSRIQGKCNELGVKLCVAEFSITQSS